MKTLRIDLPDHEAAALERAAIESGYASATALLRATVTDIILAPVAYEEAALTRDIAAHIEAKARGERSLTLSEARARLAADRSA